MALLSLDNLQQRKKYLDVELGNLGTARLKLLDISNKLRVIDAQRDLEKNDDKSIKNQKDALEWGCLMLSLSMVDDDDNQIFDCEEGRQEIAALGIGQLQTLIDGALELNGLGKKDKDEVGDAKKN